MSWSLICAPGPVSVISLVPSPSCGPLHYEINTDPGNQKSQTLRIYFTDFSVVSRPFENKQISCTMKARLHLKAKVQLKAVNATVEGAHKIAGNAFSGLLLNYQLPSADSNSSQHKLLEANSDGSFKFSSTMDEEKFTPCMDHDTDIDLTSVLYAFINQQSDDSSFISFNETGKRLSWTWQVKTCETDL
jgi:hypothetical protein